jgi:hypothetical protein
MIFRIFCLALVSYFGYCSASELMVYRWVDKNNVIHFSQHQPIGGEYTEFLVSNESKIISRVDDIMSPAISDKSASSEEDEAKISPTINMSHRCKEAKENMAMLMAFAKIQYTNENGLKQVLNKQEKQQQLAINQKRTEVYCAPVNKE